MRLRTKQRLDTTLGTPLLILTWLGVRFVSKFLRRSHSVLPVRRIVVLKFQGMGSLVMAKPALAQLREWYPDSKIIFWGSKETAAFAKLCPEFDELYTLRDDNLWMAAMSAVLCIVRLALFRPDWAIDLEVYSKLSTVLTSFTLARNRAGFAVDAVGLRRNCHTHLLLFNRYRYLGEAYLRLVGLVRPPRASHVVSLSKTGTLKSDGTKQKSGDEPIHQPVDRENAYFVFHLHSGPLAPERKWPLEHWVELAKRGYQNGLLKKNGVLLTGKGPAEAKLAEKFIQLIRSSDCADLVIHDSTGKLSLLQTIDVLRNAKAVVSADTAIPHLSLMMGTPTLCLFGPTRPETYFSGSSAGLYPEESSSGLGMWISQNLYCSPCVHHWPTPPCDGRFECMKQIQPESVLNALQRLIRLSQTAKEPKPQTFDLFVENYAEGKLMEKP